VILEGNEGKGESGVGAEPELEGHVEGGLGKGVAGSADLARRLGVARTIDVGERGVGDKGELSGISNHLEITLLLLGSHCELIPYMHPISILSVNALSTDLDLHLGDNLFAGEIEPSGINTSTLRKGSGVAHILVNLGKSDLEVCAVGEVAVPADDTCDTSTEIGLSVKCLFNGFNGKVGIASIRDLPESDLWVTR
jgi:hypothetical protein